MATSGEAPPSGAPNRAGGARLRRRELALRALLVVAVLAALALFAWSRTAERRALEGMDPERRRVLYERTLSETEALCDERPRSDALEERCIRQVEFLVQFPECDDRCQAIARRHAPRPVK